MSKLQARLYFLYPVLLGIFVLLYSVLFTNPHKILYLYQWEISVGIALTAGIVSFYINTKTDKVGWSAVVLLIASLIIIWAFILFILPTVSGVAHMGFPLSFLGFIAATIVSGLLYVVLCCIYYIIYKFFEWIFDVDPKLKLPEDANRIE